MFCIDIHMIHLLGEDEGVAVVGQMVSWGRVDLLLSGRRFGSGGGRCQ